jgi:hypothetical protein
VREQLTNRVAQENCASKTVLPPLPLRPTSTDAILQPQLDPPAGADSPPPVFTYPAGRTDEQRLRVQREEGESCSAQRPLRRSGCIHSCLAHCQWNSARAALPRGRSSCLEAQGRKQDKPVSDKEERHHARVLSPSLAPDRQWSSDRHRKQAPLTQLLPAAQTNEHAHASPQAAAAAADRGEGGSLRWLSGASVALQSPLCVWFSVSRFRRGVLEISRSRQLFFACACVC